MLFINLLISFFKYKNSIFRMSKSEYVPRANKCVRHIRRPNARLKGNILNAKKCLEYCYLR